MLSGAEIAVVARVESPDMAGFAVRVGYRRPIAESASGHILFAHQPHHVQRRLEAVIVLTGPATSVIETLVDGAKAIAAQGYLTKPSFAVTSVTDVAAPIFNRPAEGAAASLTVPYFSGPSACVSLKHSIECFSQAAAEISRELGRN